MKTFFMAITALLFSAMLSYAQEGSSAKPFKEDCFSPKQWTDKMKSIQAHPVYMGDELDGGLTVVMVLPDLDMAVFHISSDGKKVCLRATGSGGYWDRRELMDRSKEREASLVK